MIVSLLPGPVSAPEAYRALFGAEPVAAWLDSARCEGGLARWSYLGAPGPTGEVLSYRVGSDGCWSRRTAVCRKAARTISRRATPTSAVA